MKKRPDARALIQTRCAIYTRKSTEEGLEQEFNSLDAQRESGEAYIASQKSEGWVCLPDRYDDGGFTGGNTERPALKRLMADIEAGRVDCIVVYKVDRLSRSLTDFARLLEVFERKKISFVSVTQQFNTSQSMGRLTLNILLSFAQFEREIISERTRDKIAAARRKGKWSGGRWVLGYDVDPVTKRLVVNEAEASLIREVFALYLAKQSLLEVAKELNRRRITTKEVRTTKGKTYGGREWDKPAIQKLLCNVLYTGRVRHKDECFPGEQAAIIEMEEWERVQAILRHNGRTGGSLARNKHGALLKGLLRCAPCGVAMGHTTTSKGANRVYRYYVCQRAQKQGWGSCPCRSLPADEIERFVVDRIRSIGRDPDVLAMTLDRSRARADEVIAEAERELAEVERELAGLHRDLARTAGDAATNAHAATRLADLHEKVRGGDERARGLRERIETADADRMTKEEVDEALADFDGVWSRLTPREQTRLVRDLVQCVDYDAAKGSVSITFHPLGLRSIGGKATKEAVS